MGCSSNHIVCYEDFYKSSYEESQICHLSHPTQPTPPNCVIETLKKINKLQQTPTKPTQSCLSCNKPFLGHYSKANTRPIIIYLENGTPFEVIYLDQIGFEPCPIFRIEEIRGTCATLRALAYKKNSNHLNTNRQETQLIATKTCVTLDLTAIKAIQCLDDVYLNLTDCK